LRIGNPDRTFVIDDVDVVEVAVARIWNRHIQLTQEAVGVLHVEDKGHAIGGQTGCSKLALAAAGSPQGSWRRIVKFGYLFFGIAEITILGWENGILGWENRRTMMTFRTLRNRVRI
jgi:hypothetical protein